MLKRYEKIVIPYYKY